MKKTMIFFLLMLTAITASAQSTAQDIETKEDSFGKKRMMRAIKM